MNFAANRNQNILSRYCFIELSQKVLNFHTAKNWRTITSITQE